MESDSTTLTQRRPDASTATAEERRAELSRDNGLEGSSARVLENNGAAQDANKEKQLLVDEEDVSGAACCYPERDLPVIFYKMITCLIAGIIFGCALEKGRVFEPEVIRDQMVFRRWIMMKMFLAAMATGQLSLALLSVLPVTRRRFQDAVEAYAGSFSGKGIFSSSFGPFLLGIGMTLAGACPGMVLAQVGSFTKNSVYTFGGALAGALLYGLLQPLLAPLLRPTAPLKTNTVHEKLKVPFARVAVALGVCIMLVVALIEGLVPWQSEVPQQMTGNTGANIFTWIAWPPAIAGVMTGLLQIFIVLAVKDTLGGSSSYQTLVSQWVFTTFLQKRFAYLAGFRCGISNWWQVLYVSGVMFGALLSAASSQTVQTTKGVPESYAFAGGLLMLFGARFASGCTSGHGLSGTGLLFWLSWIAVPCMFAGAISSAVVLSAVGELDKYDLVT